jgi:hypothetical protein
LFLQRADHQREGPLELPVGERVLAGLPGGDHPEPPFVWRGQADQRLAHASEVRGTALGGDQQHPEQQRAHRQLPAARPDRQQRLEPLGNAGAVDHPLEAADLGGAHSRPSQQRHQLCV